LFLNFLWLLASSTSAILISFKVENWLVVSFSAFPLSASISIYTVALSKLESVFTLLVLSLHPTIRTLKLAFELFIVDCAITGPRMLVIFLLVYIMLIKGKILFVFLTLLKERI
jgi:hypothetical protein